VALNYNQKQALRALMRSPSVAAAARVCGLSERTLWRYLADEEFKAELSERQSKETTALSAALAGLSSTAIETLAELMDDPEAPASVRARVALGTLKERRDVIELSELEERLAAVERLLEEEGA
jgi:hypothetical protein